MRRRSGLQPAITVLAVIVLVLLAGAFLYFIVFSGAEEGTGQLEDAEEETGGKIEDRVGDLKTKFEDSLKEGAESGGISGDGGGNGETGGNKESGTTGDGDESGSEDVSEDDKDTCEEDVNKAQEAANEKKYCFIFDGTVTMECPQDHEITYEADNACETSELSDRGWEYADTADAVAKIGNEPESGKYNIFFQPSSKQVAESDEFKNRVNTHLEGIMKHTPFGECPENVTATIKKEPTDATPWDHESLEEGTSGNKPDQADYWVIMTDIDECNAGVFPTTGIAWEHGGLHRKLRRSTAAHELAHEFGFCDEYSREQYETMQSDVPSACHNDWPDDEGWYPRGSILNDAGDTAYPDEACTYNPAAGDPPQDPSEWAENSYGYCGQMMGDPSDGETSILGGGGVWEYKGDECTGETYLDYGGFPEQDYKAFKNAINSIEGLTCG